MWNTLWCGNPDWDESRRVNMFRESIQRVATSLPLFLLRIGTIIFFILIWFASDQISSCTPVINWPLMFFYIWTILLNSYAWSLSFSDITVLWIQASWMTLPPVWESVKDNHRCLNLVDLVHRTVDRVTYNDLAVCFAPDSDALASSPLAHAWDHHSMAMVFITWWLGTECTVVNRTQIPYVVGESVSYLPHLYMVDCWCQKRKKWICSLYW